MALTKVQKFYIDQHAHKEDSKVIAKDVGATKKEVDAYIKTLPVPEAPKPPKKVTAGDFMIKTTEGKKIGGVTIMNEASSSWADSTKTSKGPLASFKHCIAPSKKNG